MDNPFVRRIKDANQVGPGGIWGFVGYEDYKNTRVFAPIPLNLFWAFGRWAYEWLAWRASWYFIDRMPPDIEQTRPNWTNQLWDDVIAPARPPFSYANPLVFSDEAMEELARRPGIVLPEPAPGEVLAMHLVDERRPLENVVAMWRFKGDWPIYVHADVVDHIKGYGYRVIPEEDRESMRNYAKFDFAGDIP